MGQTKGLGPFSNRNRTMIVMCKRFPCDDVPVKLLPGTMNEAIQFAKGAAPTFTKGKRRFATKADQAIAQCTIGTKIAALLLVEFDSGGDAVHSEVVLVPDKPQ